LKRNYFRTGALALLAMLLAGVFTALGVQNSQATSGQPTVGGAFAAEKVDLAKLQVAQVLTGQLIPTGADNVVKPGQVRLIKALNKAQISAKATPEVKVFDSVAQAKAAIPQSNIVIFILYVNQNGTGNTDVAYAPDCNGWGAPNLSTYGNFDNQTSSLDNSCNNVTLYFDNNYSGPQQSYGNGRTNYVGDSMNDQTSSAIATS